MATTISFETGRVLQPKATRFQCCLAAHVYCVADFETLVGSAVDSNAVRPVDGVQCSPAKARVAAALP